jgi:hypothetical protein
MHGENIKHTNLFKENLKERIYQEDLDIRGGDSNKIYAIRAFMNLPVKKFIFCCLTQYIQV